MAATAPTRPHSLAERCYSVMHEAWRDASLTEVKGGAIVNLLDPGDHATAVLQLPATVTDKDGIRRQIYLKCRFDHNLLAELQWETKQTWP